MAVARTLTLADMEIARIGLGTNRLRRTPENVELVRHAVAAGIGMVDTAHTYTDGQSEATIGEALSPRPDGVIVATKGGYAPGTGSPEALSAQIEESLRRLRTDAIDLYYLHRVDPETPLEESLGAIAAYRERGQIRHVGLSEVGIEQLERGRQVVPIAAVQNRYNLAERTHEEVVDHCAEQGIAFVPFFPLHGLDASPVAEIADRHGRTGRARLAPRPLAGDAPDPGHALARTPEAEPRRARSPAE
jgi:aryl-alcohol dehydrogenase-like predicted oxidoreductase